jgi:hypothetical protein
MDGQPFHPAAHQYISYPSQAQLDPHLLGPTDLAADVSERNLWEE